MGLVALRALLPLSIFIDIGPMRINRPALIGSGHRPWNKQVAQAPESAMEAAFRQPGFHFVANLA
jgi:hypothetical protein